MPTGAKYGGRTKGTPNKGTAEMKAAAQEYTIESLDRLAYWMRSDNAKASVAACSALLDRGHGKPPQALTGEDGGPLMPATVIHEHLKAE